MKGENEKKLSIVPGTSITAEDFLNGDLLDDSKIFSSRYPCCIICAESFPN